MSWPVGLARPRAGRADLALTRRTVTLVFAPQEHHFPIGLRSKRAARVGREPIGKHATPLTEALHVPLHLERSLPHRSRTIRNPDTQTRRPGPTRLETCDGDGLLACAQRFGIGAAASSRHEVRVLQGAAPSMSASHSPILQCAFSGIPGSDAGRGSGQTRLLPTRTRQLLEMSLVGAGSALQLPSRPTLVNSVC